MLPRRASRLAARLALAAALALAACGDGGPDPETRVGEGATTVTRDTTTTTTTTSTASTTAPPSRPTAFTAQARDAVNELVAAWQAADGTRARAIAPGEVVDALFTLDPAGFTVYGCDTGEFDTSTCNLRNRATGAYVTVTTARSPQGWQVATVYVDPG